MISKGVQFGDIHSYNDLDLIFAPFVIPPAIPKINLLDIPAGDGSLDLTEALGEVRYNDREFIMRFTVNPHSEMTFDEKVMQVSNLLNGKACNITFDRDVDWFWQGRCEVNEHLQNKTINEIVIKAIVRPYKLKQEAVTEWYLVDSIERNKYLTINSRKTVTPKIRAEGTLDVKLTFEGTTYLIKSNGVETTIPDFQLKEGENVFSLKTVTGVATSSTNLYLEFREGAL